jgi:hypothetical protein
MQSFETELLTRPVGRPSHKPVFRYKSFLYQAESWKKARRVVAKVEFHAGEGWGVKRRLQPSRSGIQLKAARSQNGNSG